MKTLKITFEDDPQFTVTVDSDGSEPVTYRQNVSPPHGDIVRSLFELPELLADEETWLLRFANWRVRMETRPHDDSSVYVDLIGSDDEREVSALVTKETVCEELLSAARSYHKWACEGDLDPYHCLELSVGIDDAAQRLRLHREDGSQEAYHPTMTPEQAETFARHADRYTGGHLQKHIHETDALKEFIRDLTKREDDQLAEECYENLLYYEGDLQRLTADALAEYPDERARESLTVALWGDVTSKAYVLEALKQIPDEKVITDTAGILRDYSSDSDARELCRAAVDLLETVDLEAHLDESTLESVLRTLRKAMQSTDDPEIRAGLESVCAEFE